MKTKKYTTRTEENFKKLTELMTYNPSKLQRTTARRVGVSSRTIQRKITNRKRFFFAQNIKQLVNDDGINAKHLFLTKLIVIYIDTLTNKITVFGYTRTLT